MLLLEFIELICSKINKQVNLAEIARALNVSRSNISLRVKNKSSITLAEVEKIQNYAGVHIFIRLDSSRFVSSNTFERIKDDEVLKNYDFIGIKLQIIQNKLDYLDKDMAKVLNMTEQNYIHIKLGNTELTLKNIFRLISRIDVSLDWFFKVPIDISKPCYEYTTLTSNRQPYFM